MIVDSSVWIEIFLDGPLAEKCENRLKLADPILIPTLVFYEVYKKLKKKSSEEIALQAASYLGQYSQIELSREIALLAGDLSLELNLGMADSLILAHARHLKKPLLTLDNDFASFDDVTVIR
jgi:predicted nucleic acid-binding protein